MIIIGTLSSVLLFFESLLYRRCDTYNKKLLFKFMMCPCNYYWLWFSKWLDDYLVLNEDSMSVYISSIEILDLIHYYLTYKDCVYYISGILSVLIGIFTQNICKAFILSGVNGLYWILFMNFSRELWLLFVVFIGTIIGINTNDLIGGTVENWFLVYVYELIYILLVLVIRDWWGFKVWYLFSWFVCFEFWILFMMSIINYFVTCVISISKILAIYLKSCKENSTESSKKHYPMALLSLVMFYVLIFSLKLYNDLAKTIFGSSNFLLTEALYLVLALYLGVMLKYPNISDNMDLDLLNLVGIYCQFWFVRYFYDFLA